MATPARAQVPATVDVSVDATAPGTPLERIWAFHGYDEVNYGTTAPGQALLQTLGGIDSIPIHIRNHFLLNSGSGVPSHKWGSTNVYAEDSAGNPVYDWTLMDGIMDSVTRAGAYPLAEIGFMPHDLSVHPDPYQNTSVLSLDGGCFYPPKDYVRWGGLISAWAQHSAARYPNVGQAWQWELWNEPDSGYWHGTPQEYDTLFDYTEEALHQALPAFSLGGPAVASVGSFMMQFLQHCASGTNAVTGVTGTRLDMISFHAKGGVAVVDDHVEMDLGHQLALHDAGFAAVAGFPQFAQTPIVVSEADPDGCAACPLSGDAALAYRLSPAYAAYEVAMMKPTLELEARRGVALRGLLAWAFLFADEPYFGGYRVLSTNGIALPVLNAFRLLGGLRGDRVPAVSVGAPSVDAMIANGIRSQADVDALATFDGTRVYVLVWNYHDDLVAAPASPVHLTVRLPPSFSAKIALSHLRVDDSHGDAYPVWLAQGSPVAPTDSEVAALRAAMNPVELAGGQAVAVAGGIATLDFDLPRFGLSLITFGGDPVSGGQAPSGASRVYALGGGACGVGFTGGPLDGLDAVVVCAACAALVWRRARRHSS